MGAAAKRCPGVASEYGKHTAGQLRKTIRSTEKNIEDHRGWLKDPLSKPGMSKEKWDAMGPRGQEGLLKKWQADIDRNESYLEIAKEALKQKE